MGRKRRAWPLPAGGRTPFLETVAALLQGLADVSDGDVHRACLVAQRMHRVAPALDEKRHTTARSRWE